jgi:hypothetical protein
VVNQTEENIMAIIGTFTRGTEAGWITGSVSARRLTVLWSGAEIVRPINVSTDVIRPSVWRKASLNAVRSIRLVWMAASVYRACPLGPVVCQQLRPSPPQ